MAAMAKAEQESCEMQAQLKSLEAQKKDTFRRELEFRRAMKGSMAQLQCRLDQSEREQVAQLEELQALKQEEQHLRTELARARGEGEAIQVLPLAALEELEIGAFCALGRLREAREEAARRERECVVCKDRARSVVFLPCGHYCSCAQCSERLCSAGASSVCPICNGAVTSRSVVYR